MMSKCFTKKSGRYVQLPPQIITLPLRLRCNDEKCNASVCSPYNVENGSNNVATGPGTLANNTTGADNTANGCNALNSNTTGSLNSAYGSQALRSNTTGNFNTANGALALTSNTTGLRNTATGTSTLFSNTTGNDNTANGPLALLSNTTGNNNTANGSLALQFNTTGTHNTANGSQSLLSNTTGYFNTALGFRAGENIVDTDNNLLLDNPGEVTDVNTIRVGRVVPNGPQPAHTRYFAAGIFGVPLAGENVVITSDGQLGTEPPSSRRYKKNIKTITSQDTEKVLQLNPVEFEYKDPKMGPKRQFGLIAEDVEKVIPEMVIYNKEGKPDNVQYKHLYGLLLSVVQKQQSEIDQLKKIVSSLQSP